MNFALSDADLEKVSGGAPGEWVHCPGSSPRGQAYGEGLYAPGTDCNGPTNGEVYSAFFDGVKKGMGK
jgi:hypothetical protein